EGKCTSASGEPPSRIGSAAVVRAYKQLKVNEHAFREMKRVWLVWRDVMLRTKCPPASFTGSRCVNGDVRAHRLSGAVAATACEARGESRRNRLRQPPDHQQVRSWTSVQGSRTQMKTPLEIRPIHH